ncbi:MAG TPA: hypothetical protein VNP20_23105 [Nocardioidaceae bacterium]|nr:hypothetical protein [Nocardioidaceae bacterium]
MTNPSAEQPSGAAQGRAVYLHIGAPKTGTTFLQAMLHAHRDRLRQDGCFYPRSRLTAHHDEARDLRNAKPGGYLHPQVPGSWNRLVRKVHHWQGHGVVVISSELLAFATTEQAQRAIESLRPAKVHLLVTLRDLVRQVPAVWQETVKNRNAMTYEEFLRRMTEGHNQAGPRRLWDGQDPTRILAHWGQQIPPERVHLVTVPPRGADSRLLWQRFAGVLGVDPARYPEVDTGANTSLGAAETEVVRRLNEQVQDAPWPFYAHHVKNGIAQGVLAGRPGPRLVLPESALQFVEGRTKEMIDAVGGRGYDVAGDLDDLLPPSDGSGVGAMPEPDPEQLAEASGLAADYLAREFARSARRSHTGRQPEGKDRLLPVKRRLVRLSTQYTVVDRLRRGYTFARRRLRR